MARDITKPTVQIGTDSSIVLFTVVNGEQLRRRVTLGWIPNLAGYNIHARLVEAAPGEVGKLPTEVQAGGKKMLLSAASGHIRNVVNNEFDLVLPWDICVGFANQPTPKVPVYAYFELEVGEPGTGDDTPVGDAAPLALQVWKPLRGMVCIEFSPTELIGGQ